MGTVVIQSTPSAPGASMADPFSALKRNDSLTSTNLGGKFALPAEFDTTKLAAGFYQEGQEALSMEADQPVVGAPFMSEGWKPWKYPPERASGKYDEKTKEPLMEKHPLAGQPHKVHGTKAGENFVLMCRPLEVQAQVNHVYGILSIEQMTREQRGETLSVPEAANDPGMLTDARLKQEIGAEQEIEQAQGRSTAVHMSVPQGRIERSHQRVGR